MKHQLQICILLFIFLFSIACKKESPTDSGTSEQPTTTSLAGFGDRGGKPSGYPFYLPNNIIVTTSMIGYDTAWASLPKYGIGIISTYFTLSNLNNYPTKASFPAGLIFLPDNDSSQSALVAYPTTLTLAANATERISLRFFCMNHNKASNFVNFYSMNVVSNNDQVRKLINALSVKDSSVLINHQGWIKWGIQDILWDISDGSGLTQADLDSIKSW